jgi:protein-disulfide isomerase
VLEVEPQLIDTYVTNGTITIVARPLLQSGEISLQAAHAAECAGEQSRYFAMRERIYASQGNLYTAQDLSQALTALAGDIGLDTTAHAECMASKRYEQVLYEGHTRAKNDGIVTRPVFDINQTRVIGARPFADFAAIIDDMVP